MKRYQPPMPRATLLVREREYLEHLQRKKKTQVNAPEIQHQDDHPSAQQDPQEAFGPRQDLEKFSEKIITAAPNNTTVQRINDANVQQQTAYNKFVQLMEHNSALMAAHNTTSHNKFLTVYKQRQSQGLMLSIIERADALKILADAVAKLSIGTGHQDVAPLRGTVLFAVYANNTLATVKPSYPDSYKCLEDEEEHIHTNYENLAHAQVRAQLISDNKDLLIGLEKFEQPHLILLQHHLDQDSFEQSDAYNKILHALATDNQNEPANMDEILQALKTDGENYSATIQNYINMFKVDIGQILRAEEIKNSELITKTEHAVRSIIGSYAHAAQTSMLVAVKNIDQINQLFTASGASDVLNANMTFVKQLAMSRVDALEKTLLEQENKLLNTINNAPASCQAVLAPTFKNAQDHLAAQKRNIAQFKTSINDCNDTNSIKNLLATTILPQNSQDADKNLERLQNTARTFSQLKSTKSSHFHPENAHDGSLSGMLMQLQTRSTYNKHPDTPPTTGPETTPKPPSLRSPGPHDEAAS